MLGVAERLDGLELTERHSSGYPSASGPNGKEDVPLDDGPTLLDGNLQTPDRLLLLCSLESPAAKGSFSHL
jgi:hypothetical protein